jgi:CheY-like chemotaxis protein
VSVPILVVDDDPTFLEVAEASLELVAPELTIYTALTGRQALTMLREVGVSVPRPVFIVLDYHLGAREAPSLLSELRSVAELRTIPVLILSQFVWTHDLRAAMEAGAVQFSVKPSRVIELGELLLKFWRENCHGGEHSAGRR